MAERPAVYEHYRATNGSLDAGTYRVVGVNDEATLLRVADGDGRRLHSGDVTTVPVQRFGDTLVPAENPDARARAPRALSGVGVGFLIVALLSWVGVLTTPATASTLATIGLLLVLAGRVVDRYHLTDYFA